jgi:hypothetical protein
MSAQGCFCSKQHTAQLLLLLLVLAGKAARAACAPYQPPSAT